MSYVIFQVACYVLIVIGGALFMVYDHNRPQHYVGIVLIILFGILSAFPKVLLVLFR